MSEFIVIGFEASEEADRVLAELVRLQKEHLVDLEDAVVAIHQPDGEVSVKQDIGGKARPGGGALSGPLADFGIDDTFIRSIDDTLRPDTSALFVLMRNAEHEQLIAELSKFRGRVLRSSFPPDQEARLRTALSGGGGG